MPLLGVLLFSLNQAAPPLPARAEATDMVAVARLAPASRGMLSVAGVTALAASTSCIATSVFLGIRASSSAAQVGAFYTGGSVPTAAQAPSVLFWQARANDAASIAVPLVVGAVASAILGTALLLIDGQPTLHVSTNEPTRLGAAATGLGASPTLKF